MKQATCFWKTGFLIGLVAILAFFAMVLPCTALADEGEEYVTLDTEKSSLVEGSSSDVFELYFDIAENAPADITVDVARAVVDLAYADGSYTVMPGAILEVNVHINNKSPHPYKYTDQSFMLDTANSISDGQLSEFVGADGKVIPFDHIGAIAPNMKPVREILGVTPGKNITAQQIFTIYDKLKAAGYEGDTALTDYLLDYYNNKYETSYETFEDLACNKPQLADEFARAGQAAGFTLPEEELGALCTAHPELDPYICVFDTNSDGTVNFQVKWPEASIATFSYNIFYQDFFAAGFGEDIEHMKPYYGDDLLFCRDHGILDYTDKEGAVYTKVNQYFNDLTAETLKTDETLDYQFVMTLDGPGVGNGYANYEFSFANTIDFHVPSTQYTVIHNYYSVVDDGEPVLDGTVDATAEGHLGDVVSVDDIEKLLAYNDVTYEFTDATEDIVLGENAEANVITLNYVHKTVTPEEPEVPVVPNTPDTPDTPDDPEETVTPDEPADTTTPSDTTVQEKLPQTNDSPVLAIVAGILIVAGGALAFYSWRKAH